MRIFSLFLTAVFFGISTLSATAFAVPEGLAEKQEIIINNGVEPQSLDPHKMEGDPEAQVAYQLLEGLFTFDENNQPQAGVAEKVEHSADFKQWTFHLRPNAKWSNGDAVTAGDFVFSWQRLANPKTASPNASFLTYMQVKNAQEVIGGKKSPSELGVKALDEATLRVELSSPIPYLEGMLAHPSLLPINQKAFEKYGDQWLRAENFVGNGAYQLAEHIVNEKIVFTRNPFYWNNTASHIEKATFLTLNNSADIMRYRAGEVDITNYGIPPETYNVFKQEAPQEIFVKPSLTTFYYEMNQRKAPFDDVRVRKALNLALDREIISEKVLGQGQIPTYVFTPNYVGEGALIRAPEYSKESLDARSQQAIELLKAAGFSPEHPLEFSLLYNNNELRKKVVLATASMWQKNTQGLVKVNLENKEWQIYMSDRRAGQYQMAGASWTADYNQASTFANMFLSTSSNNRAFYKNAAYDKLIQSAYQATSVQQREQIYAEGEKILANDAALIPVYHYVTVRLIKPYVKGVSKQDKILLRQLYLLKH